MKKFKIVTLGCRTNQYESQGYTDQLKKMGYTPALEDEEADLCIVNTCTVTESADSSSRHQIRSLLRNHPRAKLVVTGCMVEGGTDQLLQIDSRIQIVPNQEKEELVQQLFPEELEFPEFRTEGFEGHTRSFVKVQDGCNSFCTYCIIPYVRGRSRSREISDVVKEVEGLVEAGKKEVVITGINVGDFNGGGTLADLVRAVDKVKGLERLRISSIDPDEINDDLADAVLYGQATMPSMHIVLQSGSNVILKRMNRKYTRQIFIESIEKMKKQCPDFTVTTDVIVGFPGETEKDFQDTCEVIRSIGFAKVHMFPYSPRKRTRAALYPNRVVPEEMRRRKQELLRLSEKTAFLLREKFVGRVMPVLLESGGREGMTPNFLRVVIENNEYQPNEIVNVNLEHNTADGFRGRVI